MDRSKDAYLHGAFMVVVNAPPGGTRASAAVAALHRHTGREETACQQTIDLVLLVGSTLVPMPDRASAERLVEDLNLAGFEAVVGSGDSSADEDPDEEDDQRFRDEIDRLAFSGFFSRDEISERITEEILEEEGTKPDWLESAIDEAFRRKRKEEATWPEETDCDRLDAAFETLREGGMVGR